MIFKEFLGQVLTSMGFITGNQLDKALKKQQSITGDRTLPEIMQRAILVSNARQNIEDERTPRLGKILSDMGFVTEEQLEEALEEQDRSFQLYNALDKEKLAIAIELGSIVNSSINLAEVLDLIMKHANQVIDSAASTLMLLDEKTGELVFSIPTGPKAEELVNIRIPPGKGIAGWVAQQEQPVLVADVKEDPRFYNEIDKISGLETKSLLCVPLKAKSKLIGVLEVMNKADGTTFKEEDTLLLSVFGYQAAMAIENARLHSELKDRLVEHEKVEEALRESESHYRLLAENIDDVIWASDLEHNYSYISPSIEKLTGYTREEAIKMPIAKMLSQSSMEEMSNLFLKETDKSNSRQYQISSKKIEAEYLCKDSSTVWAEVNVNLHFNEDDEPNGLFGVTRDISDRKKTEGEKKRLESQLRQSQKMEAMGTLAGGIAHDFNNILAAIIGYAEITGLQVSDNKKAIASINRILESSDRAKSLVTQILSFSKQTEEEVKPIHIGIIVKEVLELLRASLPTTIGIHQQIENNAGWVEADPTRIHQIVVNFCTNAQHAMRETGGELVVSLVPVELNADMIRAFDDLKPGSYVKLSIEDTGCGIDPDTLDRIFEPYFTTKEKGEGTGLGLALVHGIVKSYKGTITVESKPNEGTTFSVYLPRVEADEDIVEVDSGKYLPTGQERILIIDDEQTLVDINKEMLEYLGYDITCRTSSIEALELFKSKPDEFDLIITDMTMPQMTGLKLSERFLEIRKNIPILLCTGFNESVSEDIARDAGIKKLLMKPLTMLDLAKQVRMALDQDQDEE